MSLMSHVLGTIMGALVGDASGLTLEFYKGHIDEEIASNAMHMPGGGAFNVAPGQISDDGELTISLFNALKESKNHFDVEKVAKAYSKWHESNPFDCGMTCGRAFAFFKSAKIMKENSVKYSMLSESNGSLMRATPIPVLGVMNGLTYERIAMNAALDASLSHPSEVCKDCNILYCLAIAHLLSNVNKTTRAEDALRFVDSWCQKKSIHPTVRSWLEDSKKESYDSDCRMNIGHVKHAFTLAFNFLGKCSSYEDAIKQTLMKGGDTDTNACIVGGMIGALRGYTAIPEYMKGPVLKFNPVTWDVKETLMGHNRPAEFRALNVVNDILYNKW